MLDNAIESAEKQQEKQKRLIWLYVTREKQFVRIRTENYCDEKIHFKNGMPVTMKKDRRLHGYGMKSIKSTVEKYHGSVVLQRRKTTGLNLKYCFRQAGKDCIKKY